jgi:hypothetical protein
LLTIARLPDKASLPEINREIYFCPTFVTSPKQPLLCCRKKAAEAYFDNSPRQVKCRRFVELIQSCKSPGTDDRGVIPVGFPLVRLLSDSRLGPALNSPVMKSSLISTARA